jgi:hypothetical protein
LNWTFLTEFPECEDLVLFPLPSLSSLSLSWLSGRIFLEKRGRGKNCGLRETEISSFSPSPASQKILSRT